jgi:hypothetical protein
VPRCFPQGIDCWRRVPTPPNKYRLTIVLTRPVGPDSTGLMDLRRPLDVFVAPTLPCAPWIHPEREKRSNSRADAYRPHPTDHSNALLPADRDMWGRLGISENLATRSAARSTILLRPTTVPGRTLTSTTVGQRWCTVAYLFSHAGSPSQVRQACGGASRIVPSRPAVQVAHFA